MEPQAHFKEEEDDDKKKEDNDHHILTYKDTFPK